MPPAILAALLGAQAAAAAAPAITLPETAELRRQIEAADAALFRLVFLGCDPERLRARIAPDLEFYHDRDGAIRGADAFVAGYAQQCRERQQPNAWRSRRELVPGTLTVDPVPGLGAIESGEHVFYERQGEGPEQLVGRARFAQLWVLSPTGWRLSRVFSYAHAAAGAGAEAAANPAAPPGPSPHR